MTEVTVTELDQMCMEAFKLEDVIDKMEAAVKQESKKLAEIKAKLLAIFDATDKTKYALNGFGTIFMHNRWTVALPETDEDLAKLVEYLKERGMYEKIVKPNSASLNSFVQTEQEVQLENGNVDWICPGLKEPKVIKTIRLTKAR